MSVPSMLYYPPQFCWFPHNGPVPYTGYVNKYDLMKEHIKLESQYLLNSEVPLTSECEGVKMSTIVGQQWYKYLLLYMALDNNWRHPLVDQQILDILHLHILL